MSRLIYGPGVVRTGYGHLGPSRQAAGKKRMRASWRNSPAHTRVCVEHEARHYAAGRSAAVFATARQIRFRCIQVSRGRRVRSEEHTSELQSLMRISYAVFCLKKKKN